MYIYYSKSHIQNQPEKRGCCENCRLPWNVQKVLGLKYSYQRSVGVCKNCRLLWKDKKCFGFEKYFRGQLWFGFGVMVTQNKYNRCSRSNKWFWILASFFPVKLRIWSGIKIPHMWFCNPRTGWRHADARLCFYGNTGHIFLDAWPSDKISPVFVGAQNKGSRAVCVCACRIGEGGGLPLPPLTCANKT